MDLHLPAKEGGFVFSLTTITDLKLLYRQLLMSQIGIYIYIYVLSDKKLIIY